MVSRNPSKELGLQYCYQVPGIKVPIVLDYLRGVRDKELTSRSMMKMEALELGETQQ